MPMFVPEHWVPHQGVLAGESLPPRYEAPGKSGGMIAHAYNPGSLKAEV